MSLVVAGAVLGPASAAKVATTRPYHDPPWLNVGGRPLTLRYEFNRLHRVADVPAGALYVRNMLQPRFARLPSARVPGSAPPALVARVPARLVRGSKLFYYATFRDRASGRSTAVPAAGAGAAQPVWVLDSPRTVALGAHRFGRLNAAAAIVAHAGPNDVGFVGCDVDIAKRTLCAGGTKPAPAAAVAASRRRGLRPSTSPATARPGCSTP